MVVKSKPKSPGKKKVKVLSLKKETVKNLVGSERKRIKGGVLLLSNNTCAAESNSAASAFVAKTQNCGTVSVPIYTAVNTCICVSR